MFRATMGPSSGETTVFMHTWYFLFCVEDCLVRRVDPNLHTRQTKRRINTVVSPDDGPIVARNM